MINSPQRLKDLIRNMAKRINGQPHILMRNYMMERFLERLANSAYREKFILKGGMLVASMIGLDLRATMDIDATIKCATLSIDSSRKIIEEITGVHLEDGIQFMIKDVTEIMDEADYPGRDRPVLSIFCRGWGRERPPSRRRGAEKPRGFCVSDVYGSSGVLSAHRGGRRQGCP